jgi:hypothetical protein
MSILISTFILALSYTLTEYDRGLQDHCFRELAVRCTEVEYQTRSLYDTATVIIGTDGVN